MAKVCALCGKGSVIAGRRKLLRGHYNPTGKIRKYPNLQWLRVGRGVKPRHVKSRYRDHAVLRDGGHAALRSGRVLACAKCIKARAKSPRERVAVAATPMDTPLAHETTGEKQGDK